MKMPRVEKPPVILDDLGSTFNEMTVESPKRYNRPPQIKEKPKRRREETSKSDASEVDRAENAPYVISLCRRLIYSNLKQD